MKKAYWAIIVVIGLIIALTYTQSLVALVTTDTQAAASTLSRSQTNDVVTWIKKLQYTSNVRDASYGAIAVSDGIAAYEDGTARPLRRVTPYFSHLAALGLLDSGSFGSVTAVQRWLQWYIKNRDPQLGVPLDTWYTTDGKYGTTCPVKNDPVQCNTVDAEDSSAALFLVTTDRFVTKGGSKSFVRNNKAAIRAVEDTLIKLIDADGLSWAKQSYPVKYMMDNVEVLAGLDAAARLQRNVFGDTVRANELTVKATNLRKALYGSTGSFYDSSKGQFAVYEDERGNRGVSDMRTWYPDVMAQLWPAAFYQDSNPVVRENALAAIAKQLPSLALAQGDCEVLKTVTNNAHAPVIAYIMRLHKYEGAEALTKCMYKQMSPSFAWPVTAADAGWLLRK
jgi:hypothetical protein